MRPLFSSSGNGTYVHGTLILVSTSWFLGMGLRGIVGMWGYYLDVSISIVALIVGLIGLSGWLLGFYWIKNEASLSFFRNISKTLKPRLNRWELFILATISLQVLSYTYMAITPWHGWDEVMLYGKFSKDVANGWVAADYRVYEFWFSGDKLGEMASAQEIFAVGDTYLARGLRVVNLVFISTGIHGLLRWLGAARQWSLLSIAGFLAVPDLVLWGTSLRLDNVTMVLEISAFVLLTVSLVSLLPEHRQKIQHRSRILIAAAALAALAFASRISGIHLATFVSLVAIFFVIREAGSIYWKGSIIVGLGVFWGLCCIGYFVNIYELGNPIYPLNAPWPFQGGEYTSTFEAWRDQYNVMGIPPVIEQIYLLFHLALGFDYLVLKFGLTFLPHGNTLMVGMLWLSPAILTIFLVPLFYRTARGIAILAAIFLFWFITWSIGLHFSRIFLAGGSVPVLIAAVIASLPPVSLSKAQRYLQLGVQVGLCLIVLAFVPVQIYKAAAHYPGLKVLTGADARYQSNVDFLKNTFFSTYLIPAELPTRDEAKQISDILAGYSKPVVHTDLFRALHILFDKGYFVDVGRAGDAPEFRLRAERGYSGAKTRVCRDCDIGDCILLNRNSKFSEEHRRVARETFADVKFVSSSHDWELRCK